MPSVPRTLVFSGKTPISSPVSRKDVLRMNVTKLLEDKIFPLPKKK